MTLERLDELKRKSETLGAMNVIGRPAADLEKLREAFVTARTEYFTALREAIEEGLVQSATPAIQVAADNAGDCLGLGLFTYSPFNKPRPSD